MASQISLKAVGLNYSPNNLSLDEGSLLVADDVIIRRDNVLESRRGYSEYSETFGASDDYPKQLITYKNRLLAHYSNKLIFDTGTVNSSGKAIMSPFSGTYNEVETGLRIKSIEANKNLYFTTSEGIKKISATSASNFSTAANYIVSAGAAKALDYTATLDITQGQTSGFLPADSVVAYRHVWGYKDTNSNLLLGAPSDNISVYNYLSESIPLDINTLTQALDNITQNDATYHSTFNNGVVTTFGTFASTFQVNTSDPTTTLRSTVIDIATNMDTYSVLADLNVTANNKPLRISTFEVTSNIATMTFSSGDPRTVWSVGDKIEISTSATFAPFNATTAIPSWTITSVTATTATFNITNPNIAVAAPAAGTKIFSYTYRDIINTGDQNYATSLNDLVVDSTGTSEQLRTIDNTILRIFTRLQAELTNVISAGLNTQYIANLSTTQAANTSLKITIPSTISNNPEYFLQVYRTRLFIATGTDILGDTITPDDEMRLVYEGFPTTADFSNGYIIYDDNYPDDLRGTNANLYTNPTTGEGILQANDVPPIAQDINRFKNTIFFSNTKTRHRINPFQLLGTSNISSTGNENILTISDGTTNYSYTFTLGVQQITRLVFDSTASAAQLKTALQDKYFSINSAENSDLYYIWFRYDNAGTDPAPSGRVGVRVDLITGDTFTLIRNKTFSAINTLALGFTSATSGTDTLNITNVNEGVTDQAQTLATNIASRLTVTTPTVGAGENISTRKVLLSQVTSRAQAIDLTARSLVRVINGQASSPVNAYYISGSNTSPGQINLESKVLTDTPFYILGSGTGIGASFNPDISPSNTITNISVANPTVITSASHGLFNGDQIMISGSDSTPSIDGLYTVTRTGVNTFTIPVNVTVGGTKGSWATLANTNISTNETKPNRIYYSKLSQPESVPLLNYFDVGAEDQVIRRIFPLRDSLFVFKDDGLYRISGETAPFVVTLFDSSVILTAPDSVAIANNIIYAWTTKGISNITESGSVEISRPIDTQILLLSSSNYPNFGKLTWGVGYDSDNSYTVYTNSDPSDTVATVGFRYSNLTNTWTNVIRTQNCGILNAFDDRLYLGGGDINLIHKERKTLSRLDYADKDFTLSLAGGSTFLNGTLLNLTTDDLDVGDVLTQTQYVTIYSFNSLLAKLDLDPTVGVNVLSTTTGASTTLTVNVSAAHGLTTGDYVTISNSNSTPVIDGDYQVTVTSSTAFTITIPTALTAQASSGKVKRNYTLSIPAVTGDSMRAKVVELATYLDTDPGIVGTSYATNVGNKTGSITNISIDDPTVVTAAAHGMVNGRIVQITGTNSLPVIDGTYSVGNSLVNTFTVPEAVLTAGTTGSYVTLINDIDDILVCYNYIITTLNDSGSGTTYKNYMELSDSSLFEAVILEINRSSDQVTVNLPLQWVVGDIQAYKSIACTFTYAPITFQDPLQLKQVSEATLMFNNKAFTKATASFSSDLKPEFFDIDFYGQGNGIFGHYANPGFGYGFFGGASNSAPFRTIIPRETQRCRYINVKFSHSVAREIWSLYGVTLTANISISTRGYR